MITHTQESKYKHTHIHRERDRDRDTGREERESLYTHIIAFCLKLLYIMYLMMRNFVFLIQNLALLKVCIIKSKYLGLRKANLV